MRVFLTGFFVSCVACFAFGQNEDDSRFRLKGVYAGLDAGTNFQELYSGANLKFVFKSDWGVSLDYFQWTSATAMNLPDDYTDGVNLLGADETPTDYLDSYSLLICKRRPLSKNTGLVFTLGPSLVYDKEAQFLPKEGTWYDSNYKATYSTRQGWGAIGKIGTYWTATSWCGFQLELLGNFNEFRNYGALCLSMNFGWMPKEK
ncbi:hypothetical protein [Owenweeksia hongkongensis]|uniref:hypothetical protein n=1 Tax=Owenweeksia hongkongensis TaxID=253245 RepID=UPI003A927064